MIITIRPESTEACILWQRLDSPGHDACCLISNSKGHSIEGVAVFLHSNGPAWLSYHVRSDMRWRSQQAYIQGRIGTVALEFYIERMQAGFWSLNGVAVAGLDACIDIDLGFTPATNLLTLRRLAQQPGQIAQVSTAWLDIENGKFILLPQCYERLSEEKYRYESPSLGYTAVLEVTPVGFIRTYPGLWEVV